MPNDAMISEEKVSGLKVSGKMVRRKPYVIAIVILAILMVAGIGFGVIEMLMNAELQDRIVSLERTAGDAMLVVEDEEGATVTVLDPTVKKFSAKNLLIRGDNLINKGEWAKGVDLYDSFGDGAITLSLQQDVAGEVADCDTMETRSEDGSELILSINWDKIDRYWYDSKPKSGYEQIEITGLDATRVVDAQIGRFGQTVGDEVLLFLMDNGTVEYIPMVKAVKTGQYQSYGKIDGVDGVIQLRTVYTGGCGGGGISMIAQKADGKFYDLYTILEAQGAWR